MINKLNYSLQRKDVNILKQKKNISSCNQPLDEVKAQPRRIKNSSSIIMIQTGIQIH